MSDFCATLAFLLLVLLAMWIGSRLPVPSKPADAAQLLAVVVRDVLRHLAP